MDLPNRKQHRLENFDYGQIGCYFVTLCTQNRQHLFEIESVGARCRALAVRDEARHKRVPRSKRLAVLGTANGHDLCVVPHIQNQIIHKWIKEIENEFDNIKIDKYVIMPDHLHLLVNITERHIGRSLQEAMKFFKTMTTNEYIKGVKSNLLPPFDKKVWQKSYYDHVIRNQDDYNETWEYIENNPTKWVFVHKENRGE